MAKKIISFILVGAFVLSACLLTTGGVTAAASYNGKIVKTSGVSGLYYVASNGKRYVFPSEQTFKTWFPDFNDVVSISMSDLGQIPLVGNVLYRPGVLLIKIQTDPKIYAVSNNGVLHWVTTEAIAKALYGDNWNLLVDDVADSFFVNYTVGDPIDSVADYNPDTEVQNTGSIDANHGLSIASALKARTGKCVISNKSRVCQVGNTNTNTNTNTTVGGDPYITAMAVANGGQTGYIDVGDTIIVNFNESVDPTSINSGLTKGGSVSNVTASQTGGIKLASSGKVTVTNIAEFDMGSVDYSETFTVKLTLDSTGKILTITLTGGSDVEITEEDFSGARQIGGTVEDVDGNAMDDDSSITDPTGTFGGSESTNPYIASIAVANGGEEGYIDVGDTITVNFSEAINPTSINNNLDEGDYVSNVSYLNTGGIRVSSSGKVTITNIASFDMGSVDNSETFTVKLDLSSNAKTLKIVLTSGSDVEVVEEDFSNASQTGGTIKDKDGETMISDSSISDPTGSFGGTYYNTNGSPYITEIEVADGGDEGFIDVGDSIAISFNEAIDPESVNDDLEKGGYVTNVLSSETGGVRVSSSGEVIVSDIAVFEAGTVGYSGTFVSKLALDSTGKILTITLTSGGDIEIIEEDLDNASQTGGTIEDVDGNKMASDASITDPTGTFGGDYDDGSDGSSNPYITAIVVANGGDSGYIDTGDSIAITFNEAIEPESINDDLEAGSYVTGVSYSEVGGIRVSSSGKVSINEIASFDMGSVDNSETFTVKLALSSNAKVLTITLTSGTDVEITDEYFSDAAQTGGTVRDTDDNEMASDSSIDIPAGTFGGDNDSGDNDSYPYITKVAVANGGDSGYIDAGDTIAITFSEKIDPESINANLDQGSYINGVAYTLAGGVSIFAAGAVVIEKIAVFDAGTVASAGTFTVKLALDSTGKILTVTLTNGSDIRVTDQSFGTTTQTGGTVKDGAGNAMRNSSLSRPSGSF
ncbi:MAG: hypothetical protein RB292_02035 [Patescibacteria group bacterium]|jgi:hypothetical protein|nr:hypothetical protein [Patescibacteria group bacterium]